MEKLVDALLEAMGHLVAAEGTWKEKRDQVKVMVDAHPDGVNFEEFMAWFDKESDDE
jgi:hypothetical protein